MGDAQDGYLGTGPGGGAGRSRSAGDPGFEAAAGPRLTAPLPRSLVTDVAADGLFGEDRQRKPLTATLSLTGSPNLLGELGWPRCARRRGGARGRKA